MPTRVLTADRGDEGLRLDALVNADALHCLDVAATYLDIDLFHLELGRTPNRARVKRLRNLHMRIRRAKLDLGLEVLEQGSCPNCLPGNILGRSLRPADVFAHQRLRNPQRCEHGD